MMERIEWNDDLSVGNDDLDHQRKEIIRLLDVMLEYQSGSEGSDGLLSSYLSNLMITMVRHFIEEEELMKLNQCPWVDEHAVEHAFMLSKLSDMRSMTEEEIRHQRIPFLKGILATHFATHDMECRPYLVS